MLKGYIFNDIDKVNEFIKDKDVFCITDTIHNYTVFIKE